jgi:predicted HTH transcriptional regulator
MKKSPSIKGDDIAKSLEISVPTLRRDIAWLRENGYISREGSRKNGVWVVLKNK